MIVTTRTTWADYAGANHLDNALATISTAVAGLPLAVREAWAVIQSAAIIGKLPSDWERLTAVDVATWLGVTPTHWRTAVATGYGPSNDGTDGAGRAWWHPTTIDAFVSGDWKPTRDELARRPLAAGRARGQVPPTSGYGSGLDVWRDYLAEIGVPYPDDASRSALIAIARDHGLLTETRSA